MIIEFWLNLPDDQTLCPANSRENIQQGWNPRLDPSVDWNPPRATWTRLPRCRHHPLLELMRCVQYLLHLCLVIINDHGRCLFVIPIFLHLGYKSWLLSQDRSWKKEIVDDSDDQMLIIDMMMILMTMMIISPGRVKQALPGSEEVRSDHLQENHLFQNTPINGCHIYPAYGTASWYHSPTQHIKNILQGINLLITANSYHSQLQLFDNLNLPPAG